MAYPVKLSCPGERFTQSLAIPSWVDQVALDGSNAASYTVPSGVRFVILSMPAVFYVRVGGAAVTPAAGTVDGTGTLCIPSPVEFKVSSGSSLSFIAEAAGYVTIGCYT